HDIVNQREEQILVARYLAGSDGPLRSIGSGQKPDRPGLLEMTIYSRAIGNRAFRPVKGPSPLPPSSGPVSLRSVGNILARRNRDIGLGNRRGYNESNKNKGNLNRLPARAQRRRKADHEL